VPHRYDVVVIAASAGGLQAISRVLAPLPRGFAAAVLVVQHLDPFRESFLADILARCTEMAVKQAEDGERILPGVVYVAPPDHHLLVTPQGTVSLTHTDFVHFLRPSADLLFDSVAARYKTKVIAVALSGTGSDGAVGVRAIKSRGGLVIAQDEHTSQFFGMPRAAIATGCADRVLPLERIGEVLRQLVGERRDEGRK
jgi:two-component system, chemotaxis family, protein-glutamate methylesterase/glutaminase